MSRPESFLEMFACCESLRSAGGGLEKAKVRGVVIHRERMHLEADVLFAACPAPADLTMLEGRISSAYRLRSAKIRADWPRERFVPNPEKGTATGGGEVLMGKPIRRPPQPMAGLSLESGTVVLEGSVFAVDNRDTRSGGKVLSFCITDHTGSIQVSQFFKPEDDKSILDKIKKGDYLRVQGQVILNRYEQDLALAPRSIMKAKRPQREDTAPGDKRVELHLHTRYSSLDALTDPAAAVATAARWGHPAIAITDHGVAQGFPEAWKAAGKHDIKLIYGLEGYYINDVDDKLAVTENGAGPLDQEYVAFDIETTGLHAERDRITEIGATLFRNGEILDSFNTFVDPEMAIPPKITELTGITNADVRGAPDEGTALRAFLEFAGGRPLIAHNADFDIGFLAETAQRCDIPFAPVYLDSLVLSQSLLPEMRRHKLNLVADRLGLPEFNHHRASDDAATVAYMMAKFLPMLAERGLTRLEELNPALTRLRQSHNNRPKARHIILLVKNKTGLKNLYRLISDSHLHHFHRNPIIPKSLLMQHREGLIIGSACEAGEVFDAIVRRKSKRELRRLASFYDYLEIQPICNNQFMVEKGLIADQEGLRELNRQVVALADSLGKPTVATGDVHFLEPEDEIYRHILLAAKKFADADKPLPIYFKTTDEMLEEFAYLGEARCREVVITNPRAIADQVEQFELLPKELFTPKIENSVEDLQALVYGKMHDLYGENPPEVVKKRVETELGDIINCHYDVIYMSAQKLVANSLEAGYLVGSRGSVGSSIVAYMSGITEVNSLPPHYRCPKCKHSDFDAGAGYGCGADMPDKNCPVCGTPLDKDGFDIPFETFLGFGGGKVPDIDLNFSGEYQARAHKYTEELFGRDHVFRAGTIGTLAEKTAYGYVKKYLEEKGMVVTKAEENRLAAGCVGVKRTTGQHPGGLVIIPQDMDVTDFCPVQHPADDATSDIITTHFEYHCMEANLLKLDELGHDDPTMIRMLEDMTGVDAKKIHLDDPETMGIFQSPAPLGLPDDDPIVGKTGSIGIPEFGTGFTRQMLVDTQPDAFDTLVRLSGFSHGTDVWLGNAKDLILSGTASVKETIGCRDDIMLYLISCGLPEKRAFKIMEAVRKGRGLPEGAEEEMVAAGVPDWYIGSCKKIKYLFPKAHAVAYVMMAFRIAWFKVHKPLAFYSAYFYRRSQKDGFDAESMTQGIDTVRKRIGEIQRNPNATAKEQDLLTTLEAVYEFYLRGFSFANIDLYKSHATKFLLEGDKQLRPPFVAISGLGETAAADLMRCQETGKRFVSVEEVSANCTRVSQSHLEVLKSLGALGEMPDTSQMSLF